MMTKIYLSNKNLKNIEAFPRPAFTDFSVF